MIDTSNSRIIGRVLFVDGVTRDVDEDRCLPSSRRIATRRAELAQPHGAAVGKDGTIYIADRSNDCILKIERWAFRLVLEDGAHLNHPDV
jgi:NHL repeat